ncbi:MAG: VWA domain-containing protein [Nitrospirae bacterium]|nr:MAG: VWA domain-containing protein [Nitrospirota bacterium]
MPDKSDSLDDRLLAHMAEVLDRSVATDLVTRLIQAGTATAVLALLEELKDASPKATAAALEALPELLRRGAWESVVSWLDLAVALAESSGATALRYVKESPLVLGLFESASTRERALGLALELADRDVNVALEFIRAAPALLAVLPNAQLAPWVEAGLDLARLDHILGLEFFRQSPSIAAVVPMDQVRAWVGFGVKLITQNSLGKTDYIGTMEFFRTSPAILGDIRGATVRKLVVELGSLLADRDPHRAIVCLAESPALLRSVPSEAWRIKLLQYGALIAEQDAETTLAYLRRCPEILALIGESAAASEKFEEWYRSGMEVLAYSAEGARAYFALETKKALVSLEQALSGVPLRQIARSLKLFAQGLCGTDVMIRSLPDSAGAGAGMDQSGRVSQEPVRATVSPDGRTIALPSIVRRYASREDNVRLYTVMTAHEAGHLEFGTYNLPLGSLGDVVDALRQRYGREDAQDVQSLAQVFALYPQPGLARDLWTVLEDARVEYRLQQEYPGLKHELALLAREAVTTRSLLHGLSVRELVVDALLLLSTAEPGTVQIPDSIRDLVERLWALSQVVLTPSAAAEDVVRLVDRLYVAMDEALTSTVCQETNQEEPAQEVDQGAGPKASEETAGQYQSVTNWAYRGVMNPDMVRDRNEAGDEAGGSGDAGSVAPAAPMTLAPVGSEQGESEGRSDRVPGERRSELAGSALAPGSEPASVIEHMLEVGDDRRERHGAAPSQAKTFLYDEWDGLIQDYRSGWCRVAERVAPEGSPDFVETTLAEHGAEVRLLRRYFEGLRPPGLRRVTGQMDGEELDLDAAIGRMADLAAGADPSDRIYVRREKRERDVAVAFLVDLSGSTSRQIESQGPQEERRRVIDVEKEGLVLLCEALGAIGDQHAIYGYSGQGRQQVDFVILKDFDEPVGRRSGSRIGGLVPLHQNRDGAAIRHATRKLLAREARNRLLVLISDGKPLDDGYADEYSLEDTKMALREARMKRVEPFCITVDREADDYLKRMYGEIRFLIIDHVGALPGQLPRVYQQLTKS